MQVFVYSSNQRLIPTGMRKYSCQSQEYFLTTLHRVRWIEYSTLCHYYWFYPEHNCHLPNHIYIFETKINSSMYSYKALYVYVFMYFLQCYVALRIYYRLIWFIILNMIWTRNNMHVMMIIILSVQLYNFIIVVVSQCHFILLLHYYSIQYFWFG